MLELFKIFTPKTGKLNATCPATCPATYLHQSHWGSMGQADHEGVRANCLAHKIGSQRESRRCSYTVQLITDRSLLHGVIETVVELVQAVTVELHVALCGLLVQIALLEGRQLQVLRVA